MAWQVVFSKRSKQDLERILRYIAKDDAAVAEGFVFRLIDAAERLKLMPYIGPPAEFRPGARFYPIASYLIVYRAEENRRTVKILRFWHSARGRRPKR
jgi:plasmid stabilization system protein ParE